MKDTFGRWSKVGPYDIDTVAHMILTGRKASEVKPSTHLEPLLGTSVSILDFGCGFGRNALYFAKKYPARTITGYDNEAMLSRVPDICQIHYDGVMPPNLTLTSYWNHLRVKRFDCIFCTLVLQHIPEDVLIQYLRDFKEMTKRLIVFGRRFNDEKQKSTWTILVENGYTPTWFYKNETPIPFEAEGDLHDHNTAVYVG